MVKNTDTLGRYFMQDTVCCGCSVVCDDVTINITKKEIQSLGLCSLGHAYCNSIRSKTRLKKPLIKADSTTLKPVTLKAAYKKANSILSSSKRPLLFGWSNSTTEVSLIGLKLAKHLKGVYDSTASFEYGQLLNHKLFGGETGTVSLEDVRNFADFIVYWGVNPAESHHRHASRYTVFPKGEKIPEGRESRTIAVLDIRETESMRLANHQIILDSDHGDEDFLTNLLSEIKGATGTVPDKIGGIPAIEFLSFAKQIQKADYIAIFYGNGLLHSAHSSRTLPLLSKVVHSLNEKNRPCVTLPMVTYCNSTGVVTTSQSETKIPYSVDFNSRPPKRYQSVSKGLLANEFDAALIVGWDAISLLPAPIAKALQKIPLITLSTQPTLTTHKSAVVFPTALTGVETTGTVSRMDGTAVTLQPFAQPPANIPSEEQVLEQLITHLGVK
jgi:formylmethanofuran dehydrogenase subunit B